MIERPLTVPTLGERLDAQARLLRSRREPEFSWAATFGVLAHRLTELSAPFEGRFDRVEASPGMRHPVPAFRARAVPPADPVSAKSHATGPTGSVPASDGRPASSGDDPGPGRDLPAEVRRSLRDVSGSAADLIRVHADGPADAIARAHDADAVTAGADVFFRDGRLGYADRHAMALLAHEASHVSDLLQPGFVRTPGSRGSAANEARALGQEHAVLSGASRTVAASGSAPVGSAPHTPGTAGRRGPAPAATGVHRAATNRDPGPTAAPEVDLEALRRGVVADLMLQLRTEFERGG
jgi:Domain of unknown function (DUF4157)